MVYSGSLPETLTPGCSAALMVDVACDPLVRDLRPDFFYSPQSLSRICTDICSQALATWMSSIRSQCDKQTILGDLDVESSALVIPGSLSIFNYVSEIPEGAEKPDDCDACLAARLRLHAGSPYFDGPIVASESLYESMTSSCAITGKPVMTTTLDYFTSEPQPTESVCDGFDYIIEPSDDCYTISKSQGMGTAWLLAENNLDAYCAHFPASGTLCIINKCKIVTVGINATCSAIASVTNITEAQLHAWNPIIDFACSNLNLMNGTELCVDAPGRKFVEPTADLPPLTPTESVPIPTNAAEDSKKPCGRWYSVEAGDYCNLLMVKFGISLVDFHFLNPGINENCTNLFAAESYCVQAVGDINTYSGRPGHMPVTIEPSAPFTGIPFIKLPNATASPYRRLYTPLPTAIGTRDDCVHYFDGDDYQLDVSDSTWANNCLLAAFLYDVDVELFATWNSGLGNITDPSCAFKTGVRYCGSWYLQNPEQVAPSITAPPTSSTSRGRPPPAATHTGQPADCSKWAIVSDEDSCSSIASDANISLTQLIHHQEATAYYNHFN
ncbi:hypothetical protein G7Z17_g13446 [Cylindrodendrum hubeiense]|uniref:LysM domain-containing protein n=1 Tax=Cylindrodendrum hubeiense TaxID=595255 RepID=A0A9P5L4K9_9HYPO|nr:hypothetical protein G7Z17_g13446 [Cylindrodendrum hubeiense]